MPQAAFSSSNRVQRRIAANQPCKAAPHHMGLPCMRAWRLTMSKPLLLLAQPLATQHGPWQQSRIMAPASKRSLSLNTNLSDPSWLRSTNPSRVQEGSNMYRSRGDDLDNRDKNTLVVSCPPSFLNTKEKAMPSTYAVKILYLYEEALALFFHNRQGCVCNSSSVCCRAHR